MVWKFYKPIPALNMSGHVRLIYLKLFGLQSKFVLISSVFFANRMQFDGCDCDSHSVDTIACQNCSLSSVVIGAAVIAFFYFPVVYGDWRCFCQRQGALHCLERNRMASRKRVTIALTITTSFSISTIFVFWSERIVNVHSWQILAYDQKIRIQTRSNAKYYYY